jgi:histone-lysine N-methyltransferase SETMAR
MNESMGRTQTYDLYKRFKDGRISIDDDPRSGRPSTSTDDQHVAQVLSVIRSNRCLTVREVAEECDISLGSCNSILTEKLGMHRVATKFVPHLLTDEQIQQRVAISQELLDQANSDENFVKTIVTGDETKAQSSQWVSKTSPKPDKTLQVRSNVEGHVNCFFRL